MTNTCPMPPTGELNATVWPSGESRAPSIGLSQWLICVIFAGPLGAVGALLKWYIANIAAANIATAPAAIYFVRADFVAGGEVACTVVALTELLPLLLAISVADACACSCVVRVPVDDEIRPESVSRRSRFKSVRMSDAA